MYFFTNVFSGPLLCQWPLYVGNENILMQHFLNLLEHRSSCSFVFHLARFVFHEYTFGTIAIDNREPENNLKYWSIAHSGSKVEEGCKGKSNFNL